MRKGARGTLAVWRSRKVEDRRVKSLRDEFLNREVFRAASVVEPVGGTQVLLSVFAVNSRSERRPR